jgi:iron complex outermembrane receptor protein
MSVQPNAGSRDTSISATPGSSAKHHLQTSSVLKLRSNVEWSATVRYVSRLATPNIASYVGADSTLQWRPRGGLEVSITGQNLLGPRRMEFGNQSKVLFPSPVERSVFGKLTWRF